MDRAHGNDGSRHNARGRCPEGATAEPPGPGHGTQGEYDPDDPGREVGRFGLPRLEGRIDVHEHCRVVEPVWIAAAAVHELPGTRDDRLLVGVQEVAERQAILDPDEPERRRESDDRRERRPYAAPAGLSPPVQAATRPRLG